MTDIQLYIKLSNLPENLKTQVSEFIDSLKFKKNNNEKPSKRIAGKAKGLISMKPNFNDPIEGFNEYLK